MKSQLYLFFYRVALICNILFVYCFIVRHTKSFINNEDINSIIITLGWGVSFFLNLILNLLFILMLTRKIKIIVPRWLVLINFLILLQQFVVIFYHHS